jgi:hypothetical protein
MRHVHRVGAEGKLGKREMAVGSTADAWGRGGRRCWGNGFCWGARGQRLGRPRGRRGEVAGHRLGGNIGPFPIFFLFLLFYFQSNSLLDACFTNSLIKQNERMLQHDATTKTPLGFYFTRLTHRYKIILHFYEKEKGKRRTERVTPEFGGY